MQDSGIVSYGFNIDNLYLNIMLLRNYRTN
jgi:hypothetical protein